MAVSYQRRCTTPCNPSRLQFHWINYFFIISITSLLVISHSTTATAQVSIAFILRLPFHFSYERTFIYARLYTMHSCFRY